MLPSQPLEHNGYPDNPDACGWCQVGEFLAKDGRCSHCGCTEERAVQKRALRKIAGWDFGGCEPSPDEAEMVAVARRALGEAA